MYSRTPYFKQSIIPNWLLHIDIKSVMTYFWNVLVLLIWWWYDNDTQPKDERFGISRITTKKHSVSWHEAIGTTGSFPAFLHEGKYNIRPLDGENNVWQRSCHLMSVFDTLFNFFYRIPLCKYLPWSTLTEDMYQTTSRLHEVFSIVTLYFCWITAWMRILWWTNIIFVYNFLRTNHAFRNY